MGSASEQVLRNVASQTSGKYYHATTSVSTDEVIDLDAVFKEIESETIDLTTDSNHDGIPDYYAKLLNDGTLRLSNGTSWLVGVIDLYGDSDDWDDDGLKNGEEISILTNSDNQVYVHMNSDPLLYDTDFDGYSDYKEVREMRTSPLKVTMPEPANSASPMSLLNADDETTAYLSAHNDSLDFVQLMANQLDGQLSELQKDENFPEEYLSFSKEDHWMQYVFDWKKTEQSKNILIDYFDKYATEAAISRNDKVAERMASIEMVKNGIDTLSSVFGALRSVQQCASTVGTLGYSDSHIQGAITKANNANASSDSALKRLLSVKKDTLEKLNELIKQKSPSIDAFLKHDLSDSMTAITSALDSNENAINDASDFANEVNQIDWAAGIKIGADTLTVITSTASLTTQLVKTSVTAKKTVSQYPMIFRHFRSSSLRTKTVNANTTAISVGFTVVMDVANTAVEALDVVLAYGKIEANYVEYQKYLDLLKYIEEDKDDDIPSYVRNAAQAITILFNDAGDPDWDKFDSEVKSAVGKTVAIGTIRTILDAATDIAGYAFPVVKLVKTVYKAAKVAVTLVGITQRAKTVVEAQVYYRITTGSIKKLNALVTFKNAYFEYDNQNKDEVIKYAVQLVQSRIVGISNMMDYLSAGRVAGFVDRGWFSKHKSKEEVKTEYEGKIREVYEVAKKCNLVISDQLPYYSQYYSTP